MRGRRYAPPIKIVRRGEDRSDRIREGSRCYCQPLTLIRPCARVSILWGDPVGRVAAEVKPSVSGGAGSVRYNSKVGAGGQEWKWSVETESHHLS
jgi:hypothetical protein